MTSNRDKIKELEAQIKKTRQIVDRINNKADILLAESGYDGE